MTKTYEKCILTFFDILGFKESVSKRPCREIHKILDTFASASKYGAGEYSTAAKVLVVSDCVVRITQVNTDDNKRYPQGLFFHELNFLTFIQTELVVERVFVRGAVVIGDIFFDSGIIYGPAYLRALELESRHADVPRIIVDSVALQEFKENPLLRKMGHTIKEEEEYIFNLLRRSKDGFWFLDYLHVLENFDEPEVLDYLRNHKEVIERASREAPLSAVNKYAWLAAYHNTIAKSISLDILGEYGCSPEDLIINDKQYNVSEVV